jgi:hypothetical protein
MTRRGLFATLAAAFVGAKAKRAATQVSGVQIMRSYPPVFHPEAFCFSIPVRSVFLFSQMQDPNSWNGPKTGDTLTVRKPQRFVTRFT